MALDINVASAEELARLPGVGPELAEGIVEYRDENGGLGSLDDLRDIPGCTLETIARLEEAGVVVGSGAETGGVDM